MTTGKTKRKSKQKPKKLRKDEGRVATPDAGEQNDSVDYGGLPERDLKKNLGCG